MSKKILWIDDSPKELYRLVDNAIKPLWNSKIVSHIYIVGDYEKKTSNINDNLQLKQVEDLNNKIFDKYVDYIIENHKDNKEALDDLYLVNSNNTRENTITSNMAEVNNELIRNELINRWKDYNEDSLNDNITNKKTTYKSIKLKNIINENKEDFQKIFEYLKKEGFSAVLIDMQLIEGDGNKLFAPLDKNYRYKHMVPILSMYLYHYLKEKKDINVFMYTGLTAPNAYIQNWEKCYKIVFNEKEDVIFYNKKGERVDNKEKNIVDEINLLLKDDNSEEK